MTLYPIPARRALRWAASSLAIVLMALSLGPASAMAGQKVKLAYDLDIAAAASSGPAAAVVIRDQRAHNDGQRVDPAQFGQSSRALDTKKDSVEEILAHWITDVLASQGHSVSDGAEDLRVEVVIDQFWAAGYMHFEFDIDLTVNVYRGAETSAAYSQHLVGNAGRTLVWGPGELSIPMNEILAEFAMELKKGLASPEGRGALAG